MELAIAFATAGLVLASPALAAQVIPVGHFDAIDASDGASVVIRHGDAEQVTMIEGSTQYSRFEVKDGVLHLVTCEGWTCPRNYSFKVEVVMPNVRSIEASDGASIEAQGNFPAQGDLHVKATDGGDVDARAIAAAYVEATASDGGNMRIAPRKTMKARAEDGGNIRYWGNPTVTSLVAEDGGNVSGEN